MSQIDGAFGVADGITCLENGVGDDESGRLGQTNILTGKDNHASSNEERVLAGIDEAGEIVEGSVGVAGAHALDKSTNGVVMLIALLVETEEAGLKGIF